MPSDKSVRGTERSKVLNLYAGIGGNRKLWTDVDVTAVEINEDVAAEYQRQYPEDDVVVADAHEFLKDHYDDGWDFIWSSPPCQSHSKMTYTTWFMERCSGPSYPDMNLYEEILFLDQFYDGDWVVENVQPWYDELIPGTEIGRHIFWSNYRIPPAEGPERDFELTEANKERLEDRLGITVPDNIYLENNDPSQVLRNAVHPEIGQHVFESRGSHEQQTLFAVADGGNQRCVGTETHQEDHDDLLTELVDVRIMLWQLTRGFGDAALAARLEERLDDLADRLERGGPDE